MPKLSKNSSLECAYGAYGGCKAWKAQLRACARFSICVHLWIFPHHQSLTSRWDQCLCLSIKTPKHCNQAKSITQPTILWWTSNSVCKDCSPVMKEGISRRPQQYPQIVFQISFSWIWIKAYPHSQRKLTSNSHIGSGISWQSTWWSRSLGTASTFADWVWH